MSNFDVKRNLTMLTDFYEITMANGYFKSGFKDTIAFFDMFFRKVPDDGGFAIMAGVEQLVEYLKNLKFEPEDIEYLRGRGFGEEFLNYLANFKFVCDVYAIPEGTPIFPGEPIVKVKGPVIQAQFIETMVLVCINHQSLIATKANRVVRAADGRAVMEFGSRRAQGWDGAIYGARAAYIGGCIGTACTISDVAFGTPALGTMAHSWVQLFDTEYDAFKAYALEYPDACTLLVDTYNVLKSGVPNAIKVFDEVLKPMGKRPKGIRIDSGDITYLSRRSRKMLDDAGYPDCAIVASNSLDENIIRDMILQGADVDSFGVGERLVTSSSSPVFGGVYKLVAVEKDGKVIPKIKISENVTKITTPGNKRLYRFYDKTTGKAIADLIALTDEVINPAEPYTLFDPVYTWKKKTVTDFECRELMEPVFVKGQCVYKYKSVEEIREFCKAQIETLWDEVLRFEYPHNYYVDLSKRLWDMKHQLLEEARG
ncbi:MAG: nicotinate phosphoribosyltransferase [Clostridia bacterium]|nr:nicotinate phosphoribosyltransferase [Clostridia bacterium]MBQ6467161.1 nicotinate phosphoribosyltransferase [Clostridia bacterium]MBR5772419.1 nicotinate phosphoribosyltransferase [Clostridia bacterium]